MTKSFVCIFTSVFYGHCRKIYTYFYMYICHRAAGGLYSKKKCRISKIKVVNFQENETQRAATSVVRRGRSVPSSSDKFVTKISDFSMLFSLIICSQLVTVAITCHRTVS